MKSILILEIALSILAIVIFLVSGVIAEIEDIEIGQSVNIEVKKFISPPKLEVDSNCTTTCVKDETISSDLIGNIYVDIEINESDNDTNNDTINNEPNIILPPDKDSSRVMVYIIILLLVIIAVVIWSKRRKREKEIDNGYIDNEHI